jgi:uncharacterized membrane protein HdeD (DUF308 family)
MATVTGFRGSEWADLPGVKQNWGWFVALGVFLIVLGMIALSLSVLTTLISVFVLGWLLVVSGVVQAGHAFWRERNWSSFFLDLFAGILALVVGFMFLANPLAGAKTLTLLIAMFLFIGGIERIVVAVTRRFPHRSWLLLNGVVDVVLGVMIWREWPASGLWVIGLFVGIDMLLGGWAMLMHGIAAKRLPEPAS